MPRSGGKTWFPFRSPLIGVVHDASGSLDASPPCFRASRRRMRDRKRQPSRIHATSTLVGGFPALRPIVSLRRVRAKRRRQRPVRVEILYAPIKVFHIKVLHILN